LEYCAVNHLDQIDSSCIGENVTIIVNDPKIRVHRLAGLRPYTNYLISIRMISVDNTVGHSIHTYERTLESAPTSPLNLRFQEVTSESVALIWDAPEHMNGELQYYQIFYAWSQREKGRINVNTTSFTLTGLYSFTEYDIIVMACTVDCSEKSNNVTVVTAIGAPSSIDHVTSKRDGLLAWEPPKYPGGYIDYYELQIQSQRKDGEPAEIQRYRVSGQHTKCRLVGPLCATEHDKYTIAVRAVNMPDVWRNSAEVSASNETVFCEEMYEADAYGLMGPWSSSVVEQICSTSRTAEILLNIFVSVCALVFLFIATSILIRKIKEMADIKIILPETMNNFSANASDGRYNSGKSLISSDSTSEATYTYPAINTWTEEPVAKDYHQTTGSEEPLLNGTSHENEIIVVKLPQFQPVKPSLEVAVEENNQYVPMDNMKPVLKPEPTPYVPIVRGISNTDGYVKNVVQPNRNHPNSSIAPLITETYVPFETRPFNPSM